MQVKKPFLTYDQQIRKLRDEKNLVIPNEAHAIDILTQIGYFTLINGYKTPFKNLTTGLYNYDYHDARKVPEIFKLIGELTVSSQTISMRSI